MTRTSRLSGLLLAFLPLVTIGQDAAVPAQSAAEPETATVVQISGVQTLDDYAAVGRLLSAVDGVKRVDVTEADSGTVTLRVMVRGGGAALDRGLASSGQLYRSDPAGGRLRYEYRR